jgi:hypothetical protein
MLIPLLLPSAQVNAYIAVKTAQSQFELNRRLAPGEFSITSRLTDMLTVVFVAYMYSAALPLMLPLAAASLALMYWVDKVRSVGGGGGGHGAEGTAGARTCVRTRLRCNGALSSGACAGRANVGSVS